MFGNLKKLRQILTRKEQLRLGLLLFAILAMAFAQTVSVASIMPFISLIMAPETVFKNRLLLWVYDLLGFNSVYSFTIFVGALILLIIIFANAISALANWLNLRISWMNNHRLSRRLLEKYLAMPYAFYLNHNSSELSKNVLSEVGNLTYGYMIPLLNMISRSILVLFIMIMLFWTDFIVSIGAIALIGGAYAFIFWRINKNLMLFGQLRMEADEMRYKTAYEAFGGIKETKVLNRESYFLNNYSDHSLKHALYVSWQGVVSQLPRFAIEAVAFGGIIIYTLILLLTQENASQVVPMVSLFAFAGYRLIPALQEIFTSMTTMRFSHSVVDKIHQDLTNISELKNTTEEESMKSITPLTFHDEIKLDNISYNYPNTSYPVIKDLNLTIRCNTAVAFVGPTGVGKTTLVDIILGLLHPQKGLIFIDGQLLGERNIRNWQVTIGYVPQQIFLCDDTVARNIAFGIHDNEIDYDTLENVSRIANIDLFIKNELPEGFNTLIGEKGIRLSGGQRQRIGIARALYHNPGVIIFDEATSALDGITEETILKAMQNIAKLKTLIIIAHRLTTVKMCDVIYLIEKGQIVDQGTYEKLLAGNKQFQAMAKIN